MLVLELLLLKVALYNAAIVQCEAGWHLTVYQCMRDAVLISVHSIELPTDTTTSDPH